MTVLETNGTETGPHCCRQQETGKDEKCLRIKDIRKIVSSSKQQHLRKGWRGPKGEIICKYSDASFFSINACLDID